MLVLSVLVPGSRSVCGRSARSLGWGIENQQHWVLDVQFGEDACRARKDHSAENLAVIRRMALNVLRHNGPPRDSVRRRKLRAALNDDYRLRLLLGQSSPATA